MPFSFKRLLRPAITQRLLSRERQIKPRARTENARSAPGERHRVDYFHQVDDPHSALAAAALPGLQERYAIELLPHVVGPPPDAAAPEREKLVASSRKDARLLAQRWNLHFEDPGAQPPAAAVGRVTGQLVAAIAAGRFVELAGPLSAALWQGAARPGDSAAAVAPAEAAAHLAASGVLRQRLGHDLGATFHYGGEWYWGIDRLHPLERRLQELGAARSGVDDLMFPPGIDLQQPRPVADAPPIDFFFSLRSPHSTIVAPRVFSLGRLTGARIRLRCVLPMVMRRLPLPLDKRLYIGQDAAREAFVRGIAFGRLNDPLGRPTERGLALMPFAEGAGKGQDYVLSFMRGVWAEVFDAGSDRSLRRIVERAGLPRDAARQALKDEGWRETAAHHRQQMFDLGLWGVPSFRVRDLAVWGQDRLWAVEQALSGG